MVRRRWVLLCALLLGSQGAAAQNREAVELHGFGGWAFGDTDGNRFLGASDGGEYSKTILALKVSGRAAPSVQVHAQVFFRNAFDGASTSLDYAFADWQLHNAFRVRVGKVKHPFGIYTEVAGLGTVRPFLNLPQAVYGPIGLVSKSYRGIGFHGTLPVRSGWTVEYDVYGGGIEFEQEESALDFLTTPLADSTLGEGVFESDDVIGARVLARVPIDGLRVGTSVYSGKPAVPGPAQARYLNFGAHAEYVIDRTWVRTEYVHQRDRVAPLRDRENAYYVEVAQFLTEQWQIAALVSRLEANLTFPDPISLPPDLGKHEERAIGLNYWVSPELGFKASLHWVSGNLIAELSPAEFQQLILTGISPHPNTRLFQVGAQFSF